MNWNTIRVGDTVTVEHLEGGTVTGEVKAQGSTWVQLGGVRLTKGYLKITDHQPGYKDGDIGTYTSESTGATYVGIYSPKEGAFMDSTYRASGKAFYSYHKGIKIIGNIHDSEDDIWT